MSTNSLLRILDTYDRYTPYSQNLITVIELGTRLGRAYVSITKIHKAEIEKGLGIMGRRSVKGDVSSSVWWVSGVDETEIYKPVVMGGMKGIVRTVPEDVTGTVRVMSYRDWMHAFGWCCDDSDSSESSDEYLTDSDYDHSHNGQDLEEVEDG